MAKRSIEAYRLKELIKALNPPHRYVSLSCIDELIEAGGPLPSREFEISVEEDGKFVSVKVNARDKIENAVEWAARAYHLARVQQVRPTPTQIAEKCEKIELLALRLLLALGAGREGDIEKMPDALRYGALQAFAAIAAERHKAETQDREAYPADEWSGETYLRRAVEGVASLHRWAAAVTVHNRKTKELQKARRRASGSDQARNEGDKALNDYLKCVIVDCWWGVCGRKPIDGPALWKFTRIAADGIGVKLGEDAARERVRKVLMRRTGKSARD